jgi:DNA-binding MarR family transcriptional regulator
MSIEHKLNTVFASDLRHLMLVSYIVLGNNVITNRFIERRYGMPVQAWSALFAIVTFPGIRAKEICQIFPRPQNTISRAIARLEALGLVEQRASATDGREKRLHATPQGADLLAEIRAVSVRRQAELFAPLTEAEREQFFALARKIAFGEGLLESRAMPAPATAKDTAP